MTKSRSSVRAKRKSFIWPKPFPKGKRMTWREKLEHVARDTNKRLGKAMKRLASR